MKPTIHDTISTASGAGAGLLMLSAIDWTKVAGGETTRLGVALALILMGALIYRSKKGAAGPPDPPPAEAPKENL